MPLREFTFCTIMVGAFLSHEAQASGDNGGDQSTPDFDKVAIAMACEGDTDVNKIIAIDQIALLPLVPLAPLDDAAYASLNNNILGGSRRYLVLKGYVIRPRDEYSEAHGLTPDDVSLMSNQALSTLGQDRDKYLVVVYLWSRQSSNPNTSNLLMPGESELNLSAKLIDKANGQCLWSDLAFVTVRGLGASITMFGAKHLFRGFPEKSMD